VVPQVNIYAGESFEEVAESMFGFQARTRDQRGTPSYNRVENTTFTTADQVRALVERRRILGRSDRHRHPAGGGRSRHLM
jgi:hypothetical protein